MKQEDIIRMARSVMEQRGGSRMDDEEDLIVYSLQLAALVEEAATEAANARATSSWTLMCKYGNEKQTCTSSPMNCQCCHDALTDMADEEEDLYRLAEKADNGGQP